MAILCGGGLTSVAGGIGQLMAYVIDQWKLDPDAPVPYVIDTRGPGGKLGGVASFLRSGWRLAGLCLGSHVDVVHINMSTRGSAIRKSLLSLLARLFGVPVIVHMHGADLHIFYDHLHPLLQFGLRTCLRWSSYIVVLGEGWRTFVIDRMQMKAERVVVIRNGVPDPQHDVPTNVWPAPTHPLIAFIGRLSDRKGVPELLTALSSQPLRDMCWQAVLGGDGEIERFNAVAQTLGLEKSVNLAGWLTRDRSNALLRQATMLVLPSHQEGMPLVVIEALAHGVPVLATPVGSNLEFLRDGETALLVPCGDPTALATAIIRLLREPNLRLALSTNGRRLFEQELDVRVAAASLTKLYGSAIASKQHQLTKGGTPSLMKH